MSEEIEYDAVVVGGGPAGLAGAVVLARSRRRVLLVDAGAPRNARAEGIHNLLVREGMTAAQLATEGRAEATSYGAEVVDGEAVSAERVDGGFRVSLEGGRTIGGRRLLVTTGAVDDLPDLPGLEARWGLDVLHCPFCHGWEVRDQRIGVLASHAIAMHQVSLFRQLSDDLTLLVNDAFEPTGEDLDVLAARGVEVVRGHVDELVVTDDRLAGVRLADGSEVALDALTVQTTVHVESPLLGSLGIEPVPFEMNGVRMGTYVETDPSGLTSAPGVWAAGNVAEVTAQVGSSAAAGTRVGAALHMDLVAEDTQRALAAFREGARVS